MQICFAEDGDKCSGSKEQIKKGHIAFRRGDDLFSVEYQQKKDLPAVLLRKNPDSFYYQNFNFSSDKVRHEKKAIEVTSTDYKITISGIEQQGLSLLQEVLVREPVLLDTTLGYGEFSLFQNEMVFLDQGGTNLMWYTFEKLTQTLKSNEINLTSVLKHEPL